MFRNRGQEETLCSNDSIQIAIAMCWSDFATEHDQGRWSESRCSAGAGLKDAKMHQELLNLRQQGLNREYLSILSTVDSVPSGFDCQGQQKGPE